MKKLLFISVLLLAFACSKEDEQKDVDPIVGSWKWFATQTGGETDGIQVFYQITFFEDGTGYLGNLTEDDIFKPKADRLEDCPTCTAWTIRWTRNEEIKTQVMTYEFNFGIIYTEFSQLSSLPHTDGIDKGSVKMTFNKDYSNVRGILLSMDKFYSHNYSWHIDYTFQIAEGSNSYPDEEFGAQLSNSEPTRPLNPLDWDQRHNINGSLYIGGQKWGGNLLMQIGSGYPYTPSFNSASILGQNIINLSLIHI